MIASTSVVIPVRNGSNYLVEAVESALAQLGPADEVIVIWDDSDDGTESVVKAFQDTRVRVTKGPERGVSAGRNTGLATAAGTFVAFLDHDDLWPADRHQNLVRIMLQDPQLDAVFGRMRIRLEPGSTPWPWILKLDGRHVPGSNLGTGLFRQSSLLPIGGFDETLRFGEDLDYFSRLEEIGIRFTFCDVDGLIYRRHAANCTNDQLAVQNSVFDVIQRKRARSDGLGASSGGKPE